jgi:predicted lipid-binding transport protein (Tim44 family)
MKIIGLVFGILLLISLIGGVAFYFIRKYRSNQSSSLSSSSINIENENNKGLSPVASNESEQSLANDADPTIKEKPNIALQTSVGNKRQRIGANMTFNNDI